MVWRGRREVEQKNFINTDKILLLKHTPFIPISPQAPLFSPKFPSYASHSLLKTPFQTQYLFSRVSPCCCASFPELLSSSFFFPSPSFSLLASYVLCMLPSFFFFFFLTLPNELALVYICPRSLPLPASSRKWLIGVSCLGSPCDKLMLRLEEATKVSVISIASFPFSVHKLYCCNCTYSRELYGCS